MQAEDLLKILGDEVAPVSLSDELCRDFGHYDNSGIILDCKEDISAVLFSLDLSRNSVSAAESCGADCIVTHHPAIFRGMKRMEKGVPLSDNLSECIKRGISVIAMHLNFDCAPEGIDYHLMRALGGERELAVKDVLSAGGYGRVYAVKETTLSDFARSAAETLKTSRMRVYGRGDAVIRTAASFCGSGGEEDEAAFACAHGADVFVSSEIKHNVICDLVQRGMCVVSLTHYCAESYGLEQISKKISRRLPVRTMFYADAEML